MKRKAMNNLIDWKENSLGPLLLTGIRGVGKTFLAFEFASSHFENIVYINTEQDTRAGEMFTQNSVSEVIVKIEEYCSTSLDEQSILIIDEFAFCEGAKTFLCKLLDDEQKFRVLAMSSYPISLNLSMLKLYPFDFEEYLAAAGCDWYVEVIKEHYRTNKKVPEIVHNDLLVLYDQFLIVGGMPGAINEFLASNSMHHVPDYHRMLLSIYLTDASLFAKEGEFVKIKNTMQTLEMHLVKSNKKFQYKLIRQGVTKRLYENAIQYLIHANIVLYCRKWKGDPSFKLYFADAGLLQSKIKQSADWSVYTSLMRKELRKSLVENSIAINLLINGFKLRFWESSSQAKVDFVIKQSSCSIPIEVCLDSSYKSKSLGIFRKNFATPYGIKITRENFGFQGQVKYVPVYAGFCLGRVFDKESSIM